MPLPNSSKYAISERGFLSRGKCAFCLKLSGQRTPLHFMNISHCDNVYGHKYNDQKLYDVYIFLYKSFVITSSLLIQNTIYY